MIRVAQVTQDEFLIEVSVVGASLLSARVARQRLPKSIVVAMVDTRMSGVGIHVRGVGVMVSEGLWHLDDSCLANPHLDSDA
jgi:hypothetical protein